MKNMRYYFELIVDSTVDDYKVGCVKESRKRSLLSFDQFWRLTIADRYKGAIGEVGFLGLGYADFKDEKDLEKRRWEVLDRKLARMKNPKGIAALSEKAKKRITMT